MYTEIISELRRALPAQLPPFLVAQRWFGGKARQILGVEIADAIPVSSDGTQAIVLVVTVRYLEGADETYSIPFVPATQMSGEPHAGPAAKVEMGDGSVLVFEDAIARPQFLAELLNIIEQEGEMQGERGRLRGTRTAAFTELFPASDAAEPKPLTGE